MHKNGYKNNRAKIIPNMSNELKEKIEEHGNRTPWLCCVFPASNENADRGFFKTLKKAARKTHTTDAVFVCGGFTQDIALLSVMPPLQSITVLDLNIAQIKNALYISELFNKNLEPVEYMRKMHKHSGEEDFGWTSRFYPFNPEILGRASYTRMHFLRHNLHWDRNITFVNSYLHELVTHIEKEGVYAVYTSNAVTDIPKKNNQCEADTIEEYVATSDVFMKGSLLIRCKEGTLDLEILQKEKDKQLKKL